MNLNERAEMAVQRKNSGKYNCAQAVTTALADQTGLQEEQMKQISAGFCAGMGNMQATCGALIGAGMIAGLKTEGKGTLKVTRQIQEAFREACGAITCRASAPARNASEMRCSYTAGSWDLSRAGLTVREQTQA